MGRFGNIDRGAVGRSLVPSRIGRGGQEEAGIGVNGVADDLLSRASFDDATAAHDVDAVTDVARGCDVMGDVEDRHSFGLTQIRQQVENVQTDGGVEHRCWFVGQQNLRADRQSSGDGDALTADHPKGQWGSG